jgi:hypothetical protein
MKFILAMLSLILTTVISGSFIVYALFLMLISCGAYWQGAGSRESEIACTGDYWWAPVAIGTFIASIVAMWFLYRLRKYPAIKNDQP